MKMAPKENGAIGGLVMKCPYLEGIYFQWCKASKGVYIPSQFEFKEYCTSDGYKICPGYYNATFESKDSITGRDRLISNGKG